MWEMLICWRRRKTQRELPWEHLASTSVCITRATSPVAYPLGTSWALLLAGCFSFFLVPKAARYGR